MTSPDRSTFYQQYHLARVLSSPNRRSRAGLYCCIENRIPLRTGEGASRCNADKRLLLKTL